MVIAFVALPMGCGIITSPGNVRQTSSGGARHDSNILNILAFLLHSALTGRHTSTGVLCLPSAGCHQDGTERTSMSFGVIGQDVQPTSPHLVAPIIPWCRPFHYGV